jgi:hypothetical protein
MNSELTVEYDFISYVIEQMIATFSGIPCYVWVKGVEAYRFGSFLCSRILQGIS